MRRGLLILTAVCAIACGAFAQGTGARCAARSGVVPYDDENAIMKLAYRDSPFLMELSEGWSQKQTDSSIVYTYVLDVEKTWKEFRVFLNVCCGRACRVSLGGKEVGYADDSRHWNEFELNGLLKYGKRNTLTVEAMKQAPGALLESGASEPGMNGTPYLLFKGDPNVADLLLVADYEAGSLTGSLSADVTVFNSKKKGKYYLELEIWDPQGQTLDRMGRWVVFDKEDKVVVDMSRSWNGVAPWTAETPVLYTAVLRLRNEKMEEEEVVGTRFGFRRVEVKDGLLTVNGKAVTLRGLVYSREMRATPAAREEMRAVLKRLKQNNINAVRTQLSPMPEAFYELCDELGLYVVCDANLLPVSSQRQAVATDKEFVPLFERRVENLYGTYKNHASIVAWSLGDSRDNGICMAAAFRQLKTLEKSRPVLFSGAEFSENTDVVAFHNPSEQELRQAAAKGGDRPMLILSAPLQGYDKLWGRVEKTRTLQGAFVSNPEERYWADLKGLYSPFDVQMVKQTADDVEFLVSNRNDFSDFSNNILEYTIYTNLHSNITAGDLQLAIRGGGAETVKLQVPPVTLKPGEEMFVRFDLERRKAKPEERHLGTVVYPLSGLKSQPRTPFLNDSGLPVDSCDMGMVALQFVGHEDWKSTVLAALRTAPDSSTACVDAMTQYAAGGRPMCDVRATYTCFGSGDMVVDYTLSPTDAFRGDLLPQLVVPLPQRQGDTLWWFGLDREVCFPERNSAIPGTYDWPREKCQDFTRQQVRWCAVSKDIDGFYVSLTGDRFAMTVDGDRLLLVPAANSKQFRIHLRDYVPMLTSGLFVDDTTYVVDTVRQRPEDFYGTEMPVMKTGIIEPPLIVASAPRFSQPLTVTLSSPAVQPQAPAQPAPKKGKKTTQPLSHSDTQSLLRYTLDGTEPTAESPLYTGPITLSTTTVVKARVYSGDGTPSFTATRKFNYDYIVSTSFSRKPNTPFNVGTDTLLFDGEKGYVEDLQEGWLGFSGDGVVTTVELSKPIDVESVTLRYAHAPSNWAFAPRKVTVYLSSDGEHYSDTLQVDIPFDPASEEEKNPRVVELNVPVGRQAVAFLKVDAQAIASVPAWHRAKGLKPWLLMDEIEVSEQLRVEK